MNKKLTLTILTLTTLLFTACGSTNNNIESNNTEDTSVFETQEFKISRPTIWTTITQKEMTSEVPKGTIVVFRNNIKNETFTANVNVLKREIQTPISSLDFAKQVINRESQGLVNYKEQKKEQIKIKSGDTEDTTLINYFEAKESTNKPTINYIQTYAVKDHSGFIITGAFSKKEEKNTMQIIENIVKSFKVK